MGPHPLGPTPIMPSACILHGEKSGSAVWASSVFNGVCFDQCFCCGSGEDFNLSLERLITVKSRRSPVKISCPLTRRIRSIFSITLLCCSFAAGLPGLSARRCEIIRVYEIWWLSAAPEWMALMFDEREEAAQSQDIFLRHDEVMDMKVQFLSACLFFCFFFGVFFSWSEAQYDTSSPLLSLAGIEWLFIYHLSPY